MGNIIKSEAIGKRLLTLEEVGNVAKRSNFYGYSNYRENHVQYMIKLDGKQLKFFNVKYKSYNSSYSGNDVFTKFMKNMSTVVYDFYLNTLKGLDGDSINLEELSVEVLNKYTINADEISLSNDSYGGRSIRHYSDEELLYYFTGLINSGKSAYYYNNFYDDAIRQNINRGKKALKYIKKADINSAFSLANLFNAKFIYMNDNLDNFSYIKKLIDDNSTIISPNENCIKAYHKLALLTVATNHYNYEVSENVKLKDLTIDFNKLQSINYYYVNSNYTNLPVTSPKFAEYILEVGVEDIIGAFEKIGASSNITNTIKIIDDYIHNKNDSYTESDCVQNAVKLIENLYKILLSANPNHIYNFKRVNEIILDNYKNYWQILILLDYFEKYKENFMNNPYHDGAIYKKFDTLFGPTSHWFNGSVKNSNNIIKEFYKKSNSKYTLDVIQGVRDSNKSLNENQWRAIMENYEDYENMPSDWLIEIV